MASFAPPEITPNKIAKFGEAFEIATDMSVDPVTLVTAMGSRGTRYIHDTGYISSVELNIKKIDIFIQF